MTVPVRRSSRAATLGGTGGAAADGAERVDAIAVASTSVAILGVNCIAITCDSAESAATTTLL